MPRKRDKEAEEMIDAIIARYGWKVIAGTALLVLAQAAPSIPALAPYQPLMEMAGTTLGGIGLVHKFDKMERK